MDAAPRCGGGRDAPCGGETAWTSNSRGLRQNRRVRRLDGVAAHVTARLGQRCRRSAASSPRIARVSGLEFPTGGECPTEPSSNTDVVKWLAGGRMALACCATVKGRRLLRPKHYVTLNTIELTSAKAEVAWASLTALCRRRARKWELVGESMIDHGVREIFCHRKCQQAFEYLRHGPLDSVRVVETPSDVVMTDATAPLDTSAAGPPTWPDVFPKDAVVTVLPAGRKVVIQ